MPAGRPPKPIAMKLLEGNRGHRRIEPADRERETGIPDRPEEISPGGAMIWDRLIAQMAPVKGLLQAIDERSLWQLAEDEAILSEIYTGMHMAAAAIAAKAEAEGRTLVGTPMFQFMTTSSGRLAFSTLNNLSARVLVERREFGMSPGSRVRLALGKMGGPEMDELEVDMGDWSPAVERAAEVEEAG